MTWHRTHLLLKVVICCVEQKLNIPSLEPIPQKSRWYVRISQVLNFNWKETWFLWMVTIRSGSITSGQPTDFIWPTGFASTTCWGWLREALHIFDQLNRNILLTIPTPGEVKIISPYLSRWRLLFVSFASDFQSDVWGFPSQVVRTWSWTWCIQYSGTKLQKFPSPWFNKRQLLLMILKLIDLPRVYWFSKFIFNFYH